MREVYANINSASVSVRQAMLEQAGIETFVRNDCLSRCTNAFIGPYQPALCVLDDEKYDEAITILRSLNQNEGSSDWSCPQCGETVPANFDSCWNCQTDMLKS